MTYGPHASKKNVINTFVHERVVSLVLSQNPPLTLNLVQQFSAFLHEDLNFDHLSAEEEAAKQADIIRRRLDQILQEWQLLGIPRPLGYAENDEIILTWRHSRFEVITGYRPISQDFVQIYRWISTLSPRQFLFVAVVFLKLLNCDPIFVTDGPHDEGIDCIGRISQGPLRSVIVLIQAKTKENVSRQFDPDTLYQEYGKYSMLQYTDKYREYLNALGCDQLRDGSGFIYMILSNLEFKPETQEIAKKLGVLLRSRRQLAFFLSRCFGVQELKDLQRSNRIPDRPDLATNFALTVDTIRSRGEIES